MEQKRSLFSTLQMHRQTQQEARRISAAEEVERRRAAYTALIRRYEADLLWTARRLCAGQEDQAQDLVQDALVRGYEAYIDGRFEEGTNARAWLLRILTNGFINNYRRRQKWEAHLDPETLTLKVETDREGMRNAVLDRPDTAILETTLDEPLERALATLSEELRACVILVDVEGMEYAEAAKTLNIPIGTVRSRLSRARVQLHAQLYEYAQQRRRI